MARISIELGLVAGLVAMGIASCGADDAGDSAGPATTPTAASASTTSGSGTGATGEHNQADVMFAQMMIPHHAQAIEMSDIVLAKEGVDDRVLDLARRVKEAQGPEIEQMSGWLESWGEPVPDMSMGSTGGMGHMGHGGMGGMMSEEDLEALADADGPTATTLFLEQMIAHHEGAIDMAESALDGGRDPGVRRLAQAIIDAQQAEIAEMEELLAEQ